MLEGDRRAPDCGVRSSGEGVAEFEQTLSSFKRRCRGAEFVPIHHRCALFGTPGRFCRRDLNFIYSVMALSFCFHLLVCLTTKPLPPSSVPQSPSFFRHLSLFDPHFSPFALSPSFSLWRLRLALVVTFFISSILEGLRRDEIHSFAGGVKKEKKKEGPRTEQHFIYGAVRSLMKPEVAPSADF